jgi:hypothetical protein
MADDPSFGPRWQRADHANDPERKLLSSVLQSLSLMMHRSFSSQQLTISNQQSPA